MPKASPDSLSDFILAEQVPTEQKRMNIHETARLNPFRTISVFEPNLVSHSSKKSKSKKKPRKSQIDLAANENTFSATLLRHLEINTDAMA